MAARCRCTHLETVHDIGRRGGVKVRTACSAGSPAGPCACRRFEGGTA